MAQHAVGIAQRLRQRILDLALGAASCAVRSGAVTNLSTLTVIDYSKPSTAKRKLGCAGLNAASSACDICALGSAQGRL